jgi:hypothetical protein
MNMCGVRRPAHNRDVARLHSCTRRSTIFNILKALDAEKIDNCEVAVELDCFNGKFALKHLHPRWYIAQIRVASVKGIRGRTMAIGGGVRLSQ